jgi:hypothetical protein
VIGVRWIKAGVALAAIRALICCHYDAPSKHAARLRRERRLTIP